MIITKKHLPRRAFLRGAGVALGLPLLDSMIPALVADTKTAGDSRDASLGGLRSQWNHDGALDAGGGGRCV